LQIRLFVCRQEITKRYIHLVHAGQALCVKFPFVPLLARLARGVFALPDHVKRHLATRHHRRQPVFCDHQHIAEHRGHEPLGAGNHGLQPHPTCLVEQVQAVTRHHAAWVHTKHRARKRAPLPVRLQFAPRRVQVQRLPARLDGFQPLVSIQSVDGARSQVNLGVAVSVKRPGRANVVRYKRHLH